MAENQSSHRRRIESEVITSNVKNERLGMHYALVLTIVLFIGGIGLLYIGKSIPAYFAIFGPVVFHAGNYLYFKKTEPGKAKEREKQVKKK